jgi:hypothetical protein
VAAYRREKTLTKEVIPVYHWLIALLVLKVQASAMYAKSPIGPGASFDSVVCVLVLVFFFFALPHNAVLFAMAGPGNNPVQVFATGLPLHWEFLRLWTGFELSSSSTALPCYRLP